MKFKQYDVVRVKGLPVPLPESIDSFTQRLPVVGDIATIVEIYAKPPGYELECSDCDGITLWLMAFDPDAIELEWVA